MSMPTTQKLKREKVVPLAIYLIMKLADLMIRYECICAKWALLSFSVEKVRSRLPSELKLGAR